MSKPVLTFVTGNANKLKEVQAILSTAPDFPYEVRSQDLDLPEIQGTTQEVALTKCLAAAQKIKGPCLTEDTSLSFKVLNGMPGPYIKHFMQAVGHEGLNRMLDGFPSREAEALCTFALCEGPGEEGSSLNARLFEGRTSGRIVPARGPTHFGWDAIFEAEETGQTFAEMDKAKKNSISHRYRALDLLRAHLVKEYPQTK